MKFDDEGANVQKGDEAIDRNQGAARAISVSILITLKPSFKTSNGYSHLSTPASAGKTWIGLRASPRVRLSAHCRTLSSYTRIISAPHSERSPMLGRCIDGL